MDLPILAKLRDNEKFDFDTLMDNWDDVESNWHSWWENASMTEIARPETIIDNDPILRETFSKPTVDLVSRAEHFNEFLHDAIEKGRITASPAQDRKIFHEQLTRIVAAQSVKLEKPQLLFAGGGYGSGKTTCLVKLCECESIPWTRGHIVGVDVFKLYIPEFSLIQDAGDGRASGVVQKECQKLAYDLFPRLIKERRSFVWDSSMSDQKETMKRIALARENGYCLTMLAVLTPPERAIVQAMKRAKETRRFPNEDALPKSHKGFCQAFWSYEGFFDQIFVFANLHDSSDGPSVAAEKTELNGKMRILQPDVLRRFVGEQATKS